MATSRIKRYLVPGALVIGGMTAGSLLTPIGLAAADDSSAATGDSPDSTDSTDNTDSTERDRQRGRRAHRMMHRAQGHLTEVLTETLGLSGSEIRESLADGKSLADIAADQGVALEDLKAAILDSAQERLDQAVLDGKIDQERADAVAARMAEGIDEHLNRTFDGERRGPFGHRHGANGQGMNDRGENVAELAEFLGLTTEEIREAREDGQTMAEIAAEQGISEEALVDFLVGQVQERLDGAVESGKIDADKVDDMLAAIEERIEERVNAEELGRGGPGKGGFGHGHRHGNGGVGQGFRGGLNNSGGDA